MEKVDLSGDLRSGHWSRASSLLLSALLLNTLGLAAQETAGSGVLSREDQERFLLQAEILEIRDLEVGVTGSQRATLSDGRLTHDAHVQTVDIFEQVFSAGKSSELNFRDFWGFNIAAYRLDKLLDLGMVPVSVERKVRGQKASVTWWVDGVMMNAGEYRKGGQKPPDQADFDNQRRTGWAFQQLVLNRDANAGNLMTDENWKVWMIDFTRAFRMWKELDDVKALTSVKRSFYDSLRNLDLDAVERELGPYLTKAERKGLVGRRKLLLKHYDGAIKKRGEAAVLVDGPRR